MGRESGRAGKYLYICVACVILLSSLGCATLREIERGRTAREELRTATVRLAEHDFEGAAEMNMSVLQRYPTLPPGDEAAFNMGVILAHHANPGRDSRRSLEFFKRVLRDFPAGPRTEEAKVWAGVLYVCEECKEQLAELTRQRDEAREQLNEKEKELVETRTKLEEAAEEAKSVRDDRVVVDTHVQSLQRARKLMSQGNFEGALDEQQKVYSRHPGRPPGDEALFGMGLVLISPDNPKKDYRRALDVFKKVVSQFPQSARIEEAKAWVGTLQVIEKTTQVDIEIEQKKKEMGR